VILCYSQRLNSCCRNSDAVNYTTKLENVHHEASQCPAGLERDSGKGLLARFQDALRLLIGSHDRNLWFHYVLTEIALLKLRIAEDRNPVTIIPVVLNYTKRDTDVRRFIRSTQVYLVKRGDFAIEMHRLLFQLPRRVNEELVQNLERFYRTGAEYLKKNDSITDVEPCIYVYEQVKQELDHCLDAGPIDVKKPLSQVLGPT
jgi:hypothetical protein